MPPAERAEYEQVLAGLRAALGEPAFAAAWAEGEAMPLEQALAQALDEDCGVAFSAPLEQVAQARAAGRRAP